MYFYVFASTLPLSKKSRGFHIRDEGGTGCFCVEENLYFPHRTLFGHFFFSTVHNIIIKHACFFLVRTARPVFKTKKNSQPPAHARVVNV